MHQSQTFLKRDWCTGRTTLLVRGGFMEASHCGKQDGNLLLAQMRVVIAQGLLCINGQRCVSPTLLCIEERRGYPASTFKNHAQIALSATLPGTAGSRFRFCIMMARQRHGRDPEIHRKWQCHSIRHIRQYASKQKSRGGPGISHSTNPMRYAKFFATNSQFTRLLRKVSTNLGRRLR